MKNSQFGKELFSEGNKKSLARQLEKLGFTESSEIIAGAIELRTLPIFARMVAMSDLKHIDQGMHFIFFAKKERGTPDWEIFKVDAQLAMKIQNQLQSSNLTAKTYELDFGPLPNREQMRVEVLDQAFIQKTNELFQTHTELETEFNRLGFDKGKNPILFDTSIGNYLFFSTIERIELPDNKGTEHLGFLIGADINRTTNKYEIVEIETALQTKIKLGNDIITRNLKTETFLLEKAPLPTRAEIVTAYRNFRFDNPKLTNAVSTLKQIDNLENNIKPKKPGICDKR